MIVSYFTTDNTGKPFLSYDLTKDHVNRLKISWEKKKLEKVGKTFPFVNFIITKFGCHAILTGSNRLDILGIP